MKNIGAMSQLCGLAAFHLFIAGALSLFIWLGIDWRMPSSSSDLLLLAPIFSVTLAYYLVALALVHRRPWTWWIAVAFQWTIVGLVAIFAAVVLVLFVVALGSSGDTAWAGGMLVVVLLGILSVSIVLALIHLWGGFFLKHPEVRRAFRVSG